ncbi:MAG TPA: ribosome silencing factor [Rhabdochlamydiaceae bacterium]|jgi:ribosome-associated protein
MSKRDTLKDSLILSQRKRPSGSMSANVEKSLAILNAIAQAIYDKKGINILALDVRGVSTLVDYVIIAEGNVDKHVIAIARAVEDALGEVGLHPYTTEGMKSGDWIVLDYFDIMVHLFMPGLRDKYQLEELWRGGKIIDLQFNLKK